MRAVPMGRLVRLMAWLLLQSSAAADVIFRVPEVMVRHASSHKPVGIRNVTLAIANDTQPPADLELQYEEYFVEHDISTADARRAAKHLDLDTIPESRPGCGNCSRRELEYCETRLLADHCCCELRFFPEPFPWLPHTCYMGPGKCKPSVHDCARYARLRDCCCYRKLAERWKSILSRSCRISVSGASLLLISMLLFVAYL